MMVIDSAKMREWGYPIEEVVRQFRQEDALNRDDTSRMEGLRTALNLSPSIEVFTIHSRYHIGEIMEARKRADINRIELEERATRSSPGDIDAG